MFNPKSFLERFFAVFAVFFTCMTATISQSGADPVLDSTYKFAVKENAEKAFSISINANMGSLYIDCGEHNNEGIQIENTSTNQGYNVSGRYISVSDCSNSNYCGNGRFRYICMSRYTGDKEVRIGGLANSYNQNNDIVDTVIDFKDSEKNVLQIYGSLGAIFPTKANNSVKQPSFQGSFYGCENLSGNIPADLFTSDNSGVYTGIYGAPIKYMFKNTFKGVGNATLPAGLFRGLSGAAATSVFEGTFYKSNVVGALDDEFFGKISYSNNMSNAFYQTFYGCGALTGSISPNLFHELSSTANGNENTVLVAMKEIFEGTGLATSCPGGATLYPGNRGMDSLYWDAQQDNGGTTAWSNKVSCAPTVAITFDAVTNGGGGNSTLYTTYGSANVYTDNTMSTVVNTLPTATREGYTFDGWYTSASGGTPVYDSNGDLQSNVSSYTSNGYWVITEPITLYAQWTANTFNVIYASGGGAGNPPTSPISCTYNGVCNAPINTYTPPVGHIFNGWGCSANVGDGTCESSVYWDGTSISTATSVNGATITLTAQWDGIFLKIPLIDDANGGAGGSGLVGEKYGIGWSLQPDFNDFTADHVNIPTKSGNVFTGYWTQITGGERKIPATGILPNPTVIADQLYAQFDTCTCIPGNNVSICTVTGVTNNMCQYSYTCNTGYHNATQGSFAAPSAGVASNTSPDCTADTYTVSFNSNNATGTTGSQTASVTATYGLAMPTISTTAPTRTGYTFMGWYDNAIYTSGTQYYTAAGASAQTWDKTSNATLYAGWKADTHTITFRTGRSMQTQTCSHGQLVNLETLNNLTSLTPIPDSSKGWGFYKWATAINSYDDGEEVEFYSNGAEIECNGDITLYGVWSRQVVFTYYEGANAESVTDSRRTQYYYNPSASANATVNSVASYVLSRSDLYGWQPSGWAVGDSDRNTPNMYITDGADITILHSSTNPHCYAVYQRPVTVNYDSNGGTGSMAPTTTQQRYNSGSNSSFSVNVSLRENSFTKTGYNFVNWRVDNSLSGVEQDPNSRFNVPEERWNTPAPNYTMYATWLPNTITLNWNEAGGDAIADGSCTYDGNLTMPSVAPVFSGYEFSGWLLPDGRGPGEGTCLASGAVKTNGCNATYTGVDSGTSTDITATWCAVCNPGTGATCLLSATNCGCTYTTGCLNGYNNISGGGTASPVCTPMTYTVDYRNHEDASCNNLSVRGYTYGTGATINATCSKEGYTFGGWCTDEQLQDCNMVQVISTESAENKIFYAKWLANCNEIILDNTTRGGSTANITLYKYTNDTVWYSSKSNATTCATPVTTTAAPSKTNASFSGYYTSSTNTNESVASDANPSVLSTSWTVSGPTTVYAHYNCDSNHNQGGTDIAGICTSNTYTLTFITGNLSATKQCTYGQTVDLTAITPDDPDLVGLSYPTGNGWHFTGWSESKNYTGTSNTYTCIDENKNFYGVWQRRIGFYYYSSASAEDPRYNTKPQYYTTYLDNTAFASGVSTFSLYTSTKNWAPLGWATSMTATSASVEQRNATPVTLNLPADAPVPTYYAVYSRTPAIEYDANGGSGTMADTTCSNQTFTVYYGNSGTNSTATLANNGFTAQTGYSFSKWRTGETSGNEYDAGATYTCPTAWTSSQKTKLYAKWVQNIVASAQNVDLEYDGTEQACDGVTVTTPSSGAVISYAIDGNTYRMSPPTLTDVPNEPVTIYYTVRVPGDNDWGEATGSYTCTMSPAPCGVTLDSTGGSTTYPTVKSTTVSTASGCTLSVASSNENVATAAISNGNLNMTPVGQGSATITVTATPDANHTQSTGTYTLMVNRGTCSITLTPTSGNVTYPTSTSSFSINWGNCNGTKTISSGDTSIATAAFDNGYNSATVSYHSAGTTNITVVSSQSDQYNATDATYHATANNKTIELNKNGGNGLCGGGSDGNPGILTCGYGDASCVAPSWNSSTCNIANDPKVFTGWNENPSGTGNNYNDVDLGNTNVSVIYAKWDDIQCVPSENSVGHNANATHANSVTDNTPSCTVVCNDGYTGTSTQYGTQGSPLVTYACTIENCNETLHVKKQGGAMYEYLMNPRTSYTQTTDRTLNVKFRSGDAEKTCYMTLSPRTDNGYIEGSLNIIIGNNTYYATPATITRPAN